MDIQRRLAEGKLSEILEKEFANKDLFIQTICLSRVALESAERLRANNQIVYALF
jgi:acyl-homoserine lactone acylase PvdQ